ncbi:MAG: polyprenyl diphosphate synthase, partial [Cucumibacter sp.]
MASDPALAPIAPLPAEVALPRHVGVIMDGNGRWATARGKPRTEGHKAGVEALQRLIRLAGERGIPYLTVFSFSSENWRRPQEEINFLFNLLRRFVASDLEKLVKGRVKVVVLGERDRLDAATCALIDQVETRTRGGDRLQLNIAFNYGSQIELARATREIAEAAVAGRLDPAAITPETVGAHLYTAGIPDP